MQLYKCYIKLTTNIEKYIYNTRGILEHKLLQVTWIEANSIKRSSPEVTTVEGCTEVQHVPKAAITAELPWADHKTADFKLVKYHSTIL